MPDQLDPSDSIEQVAQPESLSPGVGTIQQPAVDAAQTLPDDKPKSDTLDLETAKKLIAETVREAIKESRRSEKQNLDKMEARLRNSLNSQLSTLKDAGIVVSPEQEKDLREATRKRIETETVDEPSPPTTTDKATSEPPQVVKQGEIDSLNQAANEMLEEAGITFEPSDPEIGLIKSKGKPSEFIRTFMQAIEAKKARLAEETAQAEGNPARLPPTNVGQKQSILPDGLPPYEYLKRGYSNTRR